MTTNAGRALLDDEMHQRLLLAIGEKADTTEGDLAAAIAAIEAEKEAEVRARLAAEVEAALSAIERKHAKGSHLALAEAQLAAVLALIQPEGAKTTERPRYTAYVDGRACHNCGLEPYRHECPDRPEGAKAE